jgi:hypothetical protein
MVLMYDNPQLIHGVMQKIRDGWMQRLDFLEDNNLLALNNDDAYVASGGIGYSRELPGSGFDPAHIRTCDLWGFAESQETHGVSPEMFADFIFPYQLSILKRFGLNCYGCCEPLDARWTIIKEIPRLRRVSVSPWADKQKMADYLQDKYIYSLKPNPADLAVSVIDKEKIAHDLRTSLEITRGCKVEIIMKDNHTLGGNPQNIVDWVKLARRAVEAVYG